MQILVSVGCLFEFGIRCVDEADLSEDAADGNGHVEFVLYALNRLVVLICEGKVEFADASKAQMFMEVHGKSSEVHTVF